MKNIAIRVLASILALAAHTDVHDANQTPCSLTYMADAAHTH